MRLSLLLAAALTLLSLPALADSVSGTIALRGTVPLICTVAVTDLNQSLNLVGGENGRQVGTVVENCNSGTGYTVSLSPSNAGKLKAANGQIPYTVSYDGQAGSLGSQMQVTRATAQFAKTSTLNITVPANAQAIAGDYSDMVTITIAAK